MHFLMCGACGYVNFTLNLCVCVFGWCAWWVRGCVAHVFVEMHVAPNKCCHMSYNVFFVKMLKKYSLVGLRMYVGIQKHNCKMEIGMRNVFDVVWPN